jgi:hypothetical protein
MLSLAPTAADPPAENSEQTSSASSEEKTEEASDEKADADVGDNDNALDELLLG